MTKEDKHIIVQTEHTEHTLPCVSETHSVFEQTKTTPVQKFKFLDSWQHLSQYLNTFDPKQAWSVYYTAKVVRIIYSVLVLFLKSITNFRYDRPYGKGNLIIDFIAVYAPNTWIKCLWNILFIICYCILMYGIHGKQFNNSGPLCWSVDRHIYFYPMVVMEWLDSITCFFFLLMCWFYELTERDYDNSALGFAAVFGTFIIWIPIQAYFTSIPILLNRFRVHVRDSSIPPCFV